MSYRTLIINLDKDRDRLAFMIDQCTKARLTNLERLAATDKSQHPLSSGYRPHSWGPYWEMTPTEVAVFESHRRAWKEAVRSQTSVVVLEDDALLSQNLGAHIERVLTLSSWQLIKLDAAPPPVRLETRETIGDIHLFKLKGVIASAAAYIITPSGAEILLEKSKYYCDHLDDFLTRPSSALIAKQMLPAMAMQGMFVSPSYRGKLPVSIAKSLRTQSPSEKRGARGPLLYRLLKELRRFGRRCDQSLSNTTKMRKSGDFVGIVPLADDLPPLCSATKAKSFAK